MTEPLTTRAELDELCLTEECDAPIRFVPDCHIDAALRVEYFKGELWMYCAKCGRHCGSYPVAD
jgi:hypothetical protein